MSLSTLTLSSFAFGAILFVGCTGAPADPLPVVPRVAEWMGEGGSLSLQNGFQVDVAEHPLNPIASILKEDFYLLTGVRAESSTSSCTIRLEIDELKENEEYQVIIEENVTIRGGSYAAVSMGTVTLLQALNASLEVPRGEIMDRPASGYRGVMLDLARSWHDVSTLKDVINLCRWYKINHLHLHLTDDQSFTFPSTKYPELATEGRSYTQDELKALNQYAYERGVILVPEIDVPGHATPFINKRPDLFGIAEPNRNPYTISMGKEEAYVALGFIFEEVAEIFTHSPYIHIGGDEAFFAGMEDDPETLAYMEQHNLPSLDELFRHFLVRLNGLVRAQGKQTVVWAGFSEKGEIEIPRDMVVMHWESQYYDPQRLLDDGFTVINATFKPLYVVNNRKWDPDYIYTQWNKQRWESWAGTGPKFQGSEVRSNDRLIGASMSAWEQDQRNQVLRLRSRIPAMGERLWNQEAAAVSNFQQRFARSNASFSNLLRPFQVMEQGLNATDPSDGLFFDHRYFDASVLVEVKPSLEGLTLRYTLDGSSVKSDSKELQQPLEITQASTLSIQAFDASGSLVGTPYSQPYYLSPIRANVSGLWKPLPHGSWEKHRFEKEVTVQLMASLPDHTIRYTLDGRAPNMDSAIYTQPVSFDATTSFRASLFNAEGERIGLSFSETYYQILKQPSLTTGKPAFASNENILAGAAERATNGRVTLWEHWGGHVGEHVWIKVDLEKVESISRLKVHNFWDGGRYYQYTIDVSLNGKDWTEVVDFRKNTQTASMSGYEHLIDSVEARYLRINLLYNSANPGLHLTEFSAFP